VLGRSSLANQPVVTLELERLFLCGGTQHQIIAMTLHLGADIQRPFDFEQPA
jgi:hypothetical protein